MRPAILLLAVVCAISTSINAAAPVKEWHQTLVRDSANTGSGSLTLLAQPAHVTFACDDAETLTKYGNTRCAEPLIVPSEEPSENSGDSGLRTLLNAVERLLQQEPTAFYSAVNRDYSGLDDAVVELQDNSVHLKPAFGDLSKGDYAAYSHCGRWRLRWAGLDTGCTRFSISSQSWGI